MVAIFYYGFWPQEAKKKKVQKSLSILKELNILDGTKYNPKNFNIAFYHSKVWQNLLN